MNILAYLDHSDSVQQSIDALALIPGVARELEVDLLG